MSIIIVVSVLIFLALSYGYLMWQLSNQILFPESSLKQTKLKIETDWDTTYDKMITQLPTPKALSITSFDGVQIKVKYFESPVKSKFVIIGAHGWTGTWAEMLKYVPVLKDYPCDLVFYDARSHGETAKACVTGGINESKDLLAITAWIQNNKDFRNNEIGWLGSSWGGSAALLAAATGKNVSFVIADAPFQDWYSGIFERAQRNYGSWISTFLGGLMTIVNWRTGLDYRDASPKDAVKDIEIPVLLLHSETDEATSSFQSVNTAKNLNAQSTFHHLDWGGLHTLDVVTNQLKFKKVLDDFLHGIDSKLVKKAEPEERRA